MAKQTYRQKEWYEKNKERILEMRRKRWHENRDALLAYQKRHREENKELYLEKARQWKADNKERHLESSRRYSREHAAEISAKRKEARRALKKTVIDAYGGKCACCGVAELEFLTIDHVNGDGASHRKSLGIDKGRSHILYKHIIDENFPKTFRVLCFNCNSALGFYGYCPHNPDWKDGIPPTRRR